MAGHKTRLRILRRDMRRDLGTSSDAPPETKQLLDVARSLGAALDLASGGAYGISIYDFKSGKSVPVGAVVQCRMDCAAAFAAFTSGEIKQSELTARQQVARQKMLAAAS